MQRKTFCIGMNKTGTTSLHALFKAMGLRSYHGMYTDVVALKDPAHPLFARFDCFSDGEMHDYAFLDRSFPGSRFILTVRRLDRWLASRVRHVAKRRAAGQTGWMRKEYEEDPEAALRTWIARRRDYHSGVLDHFRGRDDAFLVVNLCDGRGGDADTVARVASLLGVAAPPLASMPWANQGAEPAPDGDASAGPSPEEQVRRAFTQLRLPESEWSREI